MARSYETNEEGAEAVPGRSAEGIIEIGFVSPGVVSSSRSAQCQSDLSEGR